MQIRCPHCHVPFDSVEQTSWADMLCPACGSSFSLSGADATYTYRPGVQVLGHFELLQEVGAGRFGSVWKARDTQLQRTVAIKIPRQRDLDPQETEVFLRDARAAAQLNHPRIAGVHEVGREDNTVYIVTDYIDGANLSEWLTGQRLTSRESAELVVKIAEALHHAHEAGVVHRDLKPSNIMLDQEGEPHVIDFGLARRESGEIAMTVEGQVLGTPAYMSPEQARGEGHQADRRSDVYSLGVILFELLTGELPFRGDARMLIVQILKEEPPSPRKLKSSVSRDLETITLKCLQKDPAKRYQTAQDLADDLKRFLKKEPIQARPIGRAARAWRWCRRNPMVATLSVALLTVLLGISIGAPIAAVRQASLRRQAELQQKRAEGVNAFFTDAVFGQADPGRGGRAGIGLVEALDAAEGKIDERFPDDPAQRAIIRDRFGEVYSGIDEPKKAVAELEEAVALNRRLGGELDPATLSSRSNLGFALYLTNQYQESKEALQLVLADQIKVLGENHQDTIETAIHLGLVLMELHDPDDLAFGEKTYRMALKALGPRHPMTLDAEANYSWILRWHNQFEKALEFAEPAASGLCEVKGAEDPRAMYATYNYGSCLAELGRSKEAAEVFGHLLEVRNRVLGPTHVDSLFAAWRLAKSYFEAGDKPAALAALDGVYSNLKLIEATGTIRRSDPLLNIVDVYASLGNYDRAAEVSATIYRMYLIALNPRDFDKVRLSQLQRLLSSLTGSSRPEVRNYDMALELATKACELTQYQNADALTALAVAQAAKGDHQAALKTLDQTLRLKPGEAVGQYRCALIRLRGGDTAGYRAVCAAMTKQFAESKQDEDLYWTAWACGLGPSAEDDLSVPLKIAQDQVAKAPENLQFLDTLGVLLYRTGRFEEAATRLEKAIADPDKKYTTTTSNVYPKFFLAMTKWKLGNKAEARRLLAEAQAAMDAEMKTAVWNRRVTMELFRQQADALIQTDGPSDAPAT